MTVNTFTGTNADETFNTFGLSPTVTVDPSGPTAVTGMKDIIKAGGGNDSVSSGDGDDDVSLGAGNDSYYWGGINGVGSDTVSGGSGNDLASFKGFGGSAALSASGNHLLFTTLADPVATVDMVGIERVALRGSDISDDITVGNLAGTGVKGVLIDLSKETDTTVSDGFKDYVQLYGTNGDDNISVFTSGGFLRVSGLAVGIKIKGFGAAAEDSLNVFGGKGADRIDASTLPSAFDNVGLDGGNGDDTLIGSSGGNFLTGGRGADSLSGGGGADMLFGGIGFAQDKSVDTLRGGGGADQFVIALPTAPGTADRILDFKPGVDKIKLNGSAFYDVLDLTVDANEFHIGKKATLPTHHLIYDDQTGNLFFDANGSDPGGAIKIAILQKGLAITEGDLGLQLF